MMAAIQHWISRLTTVDKEDQEFERLLCEAQRQDVMLLDERLNALERRRRKKTSERDSDTS